MSRVSDREIQAQITTPIHDELQEEYMGIKCADCAMKDLEIMNIKRKLLMSKSEGKTTKLLLKVVVVTCMWLAVTCVITTMSLMFNLVL